MRLSHSSRSRILPVEKRFYATIMSCLSWHQRKSTTMTVSCHADHSEEKRVNRLASILFRWCVITLWDSEACERIDLRILTLQNRREFGQLGILVENDSTQQSIWYGFQTRETARPQNFPFGNLWHHKRRTESADACSTSPVRLVVSWIIHHVKK